MEAGDLKAMREALVKIYHEIRSYCNDYGAGESHESLVDRIVDDPPDYTCYRDSILEIDKIVEAALAKPPRACDVMSQEDLTRTVISGFKKSLGIGQENQLVSQLAEAAISAAIKCAYDTQLVSKVEGGAK